MNSAAGDQGEKSSALTTSNPCRLFSLAEIQSATNNFDDNLVVGQGGFGKVYKAHISIEQATHVVAIKRSDSMSSQGEVEFRAEIDMLSQLRHCNLVSLIGYCNDNKEMILVYDYMTNGTLFYHLHNADTVLSWIRRLKIAIGAARGLDYLHTGVGTLHGVIHRDVKTSNILLDKNWAAMISDFGLSKIGPTNQLISFIDASVKGTFGYLDPEYFYTKKLTRKTDVYAFGVVLFELLSGRLPVDERYGDEECSLVRWAQKCVKERKIDQMVDPNIKGMILPKCLRRFVQIADRCVNSVPKERPAMTEVVASLQALLELQEKSNHFNPASAGTIGFNWKIHKYFVPASKLNSDQSGTSLPKSLYNMNQHEELMNRDIKMFTYDEYLKLMRNSDNTEQLITVKKVPYEHPGLENLKEFRHPNLVKIIGYTSKDGHHLLMYESTSKWNFEDIFSSGAIARLPLSTKVKILIGIARGIVFLQKPSLNKSLKGGPTISDSVLEREKILLDEDYTAKLSGFDIGPRATITADIEGFEFEFKCNLSGYEVIFMEVLTGQRFRNSYRIAKINRLFSKYGKETSDKVAELCYGICNEEDAEAKMLIILKEADELIRERLKSWLEDPYN